MKNQGDDILPELPLSDEVDREILLHREIHFSGSFDAMVEYYKQEDAKGKFEEFDPKRIAALAQVEKAFGKNIAPLLLSGKDAEKVARMRKLYRDIRKVAEHSPSSPEGILAEAILSEESIETLVKNAPQELLKRSDILIPFVLSDEFADPLAPGYGLAPILAVELLGKARCRESVKTLFQAIGTSDEQLETAALSALKAIGEESKRFSKKILFSRPITRDAERAALVLTEFLPDEEVRSFFVEQLKDPLVTGMLREYLTAAISFS